MRRTRSCALRGHSGHAAAAPPRRQKKSRRLMSAPRLWRAASCASNECFDRGVNQLRSRTARSVDVRFGSIATDPVPTNVRCASNSDLSRHGSEMSRCATRRNKTIRYVTAVTSICGQGGQAGIIRGGRYEEDLDFSVFLARSVGLCHACSGRAL